MKKVKNTTEYDIGPTVGDLATDWWSCTCSFGAIGVHHKSEQSCPRCNTSRKQGSAVPVALVDTWCYMNAVPGKAALDTMRSRGGEWFAYQNQDLSSSQRGRTIFLQCGPDNTFKTPPVQAPDGDYGLGWRYRLKGKVGLQTGCIQKEKTSE